MARIRGINQSVNRAWRLLQSTGAFDLSRGLNTEGWQRNVREAERELGEAARDLVAEDNLDAYGELDADVRNNLWCAILAGQHTDIGLRIIRALGARYRSMGNHVAAAENQLSVRANGFPIREIRHAAERIRIASPDAATVVEQQAIADGDPPPAEPSSADVQTYQRIMLRAMTLSDREEMRTRSPGDAALGAFGASLLPPTSASAYVQGEIEGAAIGITMGPHAEAAGLVFTALRAVSDGADAYRRASDAEYRLNYWVRELCFRESNSNPDAALQLFQRMQQTLELLNAWAAWLERHQDHPSYSPPGRTWRADPHASLDLTRSGGGNNTGPVRGSVRGPLDRSPYGMG